MTFFKMHGTGNDFVVLDALAHELPESFDFAVASRGLCARRWSVGGDGLLLLTHPDAAARATGAVVRMRMWNPDGSEDMCGNGLRCIAWLAASQGHVTAARFTVQTLAGPRVAEILDTGMVRVGMSAPSFELKDLPMNPVGAGAFGADAIEYSLPLHGLTIPHVTSLSTGSAHTVIFSDEPVAERTFAVLSPQIEHHPWFPARTSIMWAQVIDRSCLRLRIWERGVGETLACGTGACAAAVAAQVTGRCDATVSVQSRGGVLRVEWQPGQEIQLLGPAHRVCAGTTVELSNLDAVPA